MRYNSLLGKYMKPLALFKEIPADLSAHIEPNRDIYLHYLSGEEAEFTVIGMIYGSYLVAPARFSK